MGYREKNFTVITLRAFRYFAACTATSRRGPSRRTIMVSVNSRRDYIVFPRTRVINFSPCSGRKIVFEHSSGRPFFIGLRHTGIYLYTYIPICVSSLFGSTSDERWRYEHWDGRSECGSCIFFYFVHLLGDRFF